MREFFKGCRRKVGAVTLAMACLALLCRFQSVVYVEMVSVEGFGQYHEWILNQGSVHWITRDGPWDLDFDWARWPANSSYAMNDIVEYLIKSKQFASHPESHAQVWTIPILPLVVPLTLLSAYLILWKPRKRDRPPTTSMRFSTESSSLR